jgi:hypothetical protein
MQHATRPRPTHTHTPTHNHRHRNGLALWACSSAAGPGRVARGVDRVGGTQQLACIGGPVWALPGPIEGRSDKTDHTVCAGGSRSRCVTRYVWCVYVCVCGLALQVSVVYLLLSFIVFAPCMGTSGRQPRTTRSAACFILPLSLGCRSPVGPSLLPSSFRGQVSWAGYIALLQPVRCAGGVSAAVMHIGGVVACKYLRLCRLGWLPRRTTDPNVFVPWPAAFSKFRSTTCYHLAFR